MKVTGLSRHQLKEVLNDPSITEEIKALFSPLIDALTTENIKWQRKSGLRFCSPKIKRVERFNIFLRDGFRCHYCGAAPHKSPDVILNIDHIIPQVAGGLDLPNNLITACEQCNSEKAHKILSMEVIEFLKPEEV